MRARVVYTTVASCYVDVEIPDGLSKEEAEEAALNIEEEQEFVAPRLCYHCSSTGNKYLELGEFEPAVNPRDNSYEVYFPDGEFDA